MRYTTIAAVLVYSQLLSQWRTADGAARAAESQVLTASLQALAGQGQPPSRTERACATRLRETANELLQSAMAQLDANVAASTRVAAVPLPVGCGKALT
jgi:hypothetical protein